MLDEFEHASILVLGSGNQRGRAHDWLPLQGLQFRRSP